MEFMHQFLDGLDGPASLTFLGLLLLAFLIGIVPSGFAYSFRVRDLQKKLTHYERANLTVSQERELLFGQLENQTQELEQLNTRLRRLSSERATMQSRLHVLEQERDALAGENMTTRIESSESNRHQRALQDKVAILTAQLQSLKQGESSRQRAPIGGFDMGTHASLTEARTKVQALEQRLTQVTADNEKLRRQLAS